MLPTCLHNIIPYHCYFMLAPKNVIAWYGYTKDAPIRIAKPLKINRFIEMK